MKRIIAIACWSLTATLMAGCAFDSTDTEDGEAVGEAALQIEVSNALNPNALNPNALNPNALNPNALNPNALNPNGLLPAALASILDPGEAGALSRQLLSYTVSCALNPSQSFTFTWFDSSHLPHLEMYFGLLGLAPSWASGSLDAAGQRWVSACLASRINWYGWPVMLSSRGDHHNLKTQDLVERLAFTREEGAFFGNLFQANPVVYACYNASNRAHSRGLLRDCAAGHVGSDGQIENCGSLQILGDCSDYCAPLDDSDDYHPRCSSVIGGEATEHVITTYLP